MLIKLLAPREATTSSKLISNSIKSALIVSTEGPQVQPFGPHTEPKLPPTGPAMPYGLIFMMSKFNY